MLGGFEMSALLVGVMVIILGINVAASLYVLRASIYERHQKAGQLVFVWLVPVVGAAVCGYFLYHDRSKPVARTDSDADPVLAQSQATDLALGTEYHADR